MTYDQKILNTLLDFSIIRMLNKPERHIQGMTGVEIILRLRAIGVDASKSTIYNVFSKLRKNGLMTKGRVENDYMSTDVTYYITKPGEKYLKSTEELLRAVINIK